MGAKHPEKAVEVVTGSLPAVPDDGIAIIESTAERQSGEFHNIAIRAEELHELGRELAPQEFAFHFFPWHEEPAYVVDESERAALPAHAEFAEICFRPRFCLQPQQFVAQPLFTG